MIAVSVLDLSPKRRIVGRCRAHSGGCSSSRPKPRLERCHRRRRAAGCCTRRHDNQRFRPERWTFARNLEGATPRGIAPDDHPDAGVPVVRDHESDKTSLHVDRYVVTGDAGCYEPDSCSPEGEYESTDAFPGSRPRRVVEPGCKRDAKPDTSRVAAGNRSTHIAPPDEPVGRVCRPVAAALSGTSLFDPESFAPRIAPPSW